MVRTDNPGYSDEDFTICPSEYTDYLNSTLAIITPATGELIALLVKLFDAA